MKPDSSARRTDILLVAGFCAFLFFYGLASFGLIGADEPRYAQIAREMLARHDWITPVLGGQPWLEKPPLYYWQAMISYAIFGASDWAARIPSAFDASLLVIGIYVFFRRFRPGAQLDAALITASCAGIVGFSRAASTDMPLAAMFSIGMLAWWAWRETGFRRWLVLFYVAMALGMLAKGPVAPFFAALIVIVYSIVVRELRWIWKTLWLPGILLFCVIALPWYVAVQVRNPIFLREFILQHNLERFSTNLYHHVEPFWYYIPVALLALIPWTVFVIDAIREDIGVWWREGHALPLDLEIQFTVFAFLWLIIPIIFFSFSQSKLSGYILPAIPAGPILLADYIRRHSGSTGSAAVPRWIAVLHAVVVSAAIVPALLIGYIVLQHRLPSGRPLIASCAVGFVVAVGIAITLLTPFGIRMLRFITLIPVVLIVAAVIKLGSVPLDHKLSARPLAKEILASEPSRLPAAVFAVPRELEYGLGFYLDEAVPRYESGQVPASEHIVVAPEGWKPDVSRCVGPRRVVFLGHYAPQRVDYFLVGPE